jgi:hypothetical protein
MSRRQKAITQTDVKRALAAARQAGVAVQRFEISDGKIVVFAGPPERASPAAELTRSPLRQIG